MINQYYYYNTYYNIISNINTTMLQYYNNIIINLNINNQSIFKIVKFYVLFAGFEYLILKSQKIILSLR